MIAVTIKTQARICDASKEMAKGHNFDSSNILNIESLFPFIFSHNMKEKGIKGRVFLALQCLVFLWPLTVGGLLLMGYTITSLTVYPTMIDLSPTLRNKHASVRPPYNPRQT